MTKKDYIKLAEIMWQTKPQQRLHSPEWQTIVYALSAMLAKDNKNFKSELFIYACQTGDIRARKVKDIAA